MKDLQESTKNKLDDMGENWDIQDEQLEELKVLKFSSWPWTVLKGALGVVIVTTVYLLYSLAEIPWTLGESIAGMMLFGFVPFFVSFVLGMTFENGKKALAFSLMVGMTSILLLYVILNLPYSMGLFDSHGDGYGTYMWWYILLSFINMISFMPVAAVLASSTNVYE